MGESEDVASVGERRVGGRERFTWEDGAWRYLRESEVSVPLSHG